MTDDNPNGSNHDETTHTPIRASSLFGSIRSLERQLEQIRSVTQPLGGLQDFVAKLPQVRIDGPTWLQDLERQMALPANQLSWLTSVESLAVELEAWRSFHDEIRELAEQQRQMFEMYRLPTEVLAGDLNAISDAVSRLSLDTTYPKLSERLLAPTAYYSRFSRGILTELQELSEGPRARALSGSLLMAEDQLSAATDLMTELLREPIGPDDVKVVPDYTLFERTRDDLLEADELPSVDEPEALYEISRSSELGMEARQVLKKTARCNRNAEMQGDDEVFRPTTKTFESVADLGFFGPARDEKELGAVVDALYMLLYEGAGAGPDSSPRYLKRNYVSDEECAVVWRVKHLRNHWFRHDYGHGSKSDQKRKMKNLRDALQEYGLDRTPSAPSEFASVHRRLVQDVRDFLALLERRIP